MQRTFTWGLDVSTTLHGAGGVGGLLLIDDESTSKRYYPIYDGSRNIVGLYDQAGALVASYEYDAFGRVILQSSGDYSDDNPFRFSTKYTDDETGLVYYGHRYYEPELGRFINRDPIEEDGGLNLYGFVGNNPVNFYDYLGMDLGPPPNDDHVNEEPDPRDYQFIDFEDGIYLRGASGNHYTIYDNGDVWVIQDDVGDHLGHIDDLLADRISLYNDYRDFAEALMFNDSEYDFDIPGHRKSYLRRTLNQVILGDFSGDVTLAGTVTQALLGLSGFDFITDFRDISHNLINWEWSWQHARKFGFNTVALVPFLGVFKAADEALALAKAASKKGGRSRLKSDPNAQGAHTTFNTDAKGNVTGHAEWKPNPQNPRGFDQVKRVDTQHANPHNHWNKKTNRDIPTPHTHDKSTPGGIRPATPDELPK